MQFDPQRLSWPQIWPNSGTCASQHFLFFDNRRKIKSRKTHFVGRSPLSRLRRRFAPLRGTQRRCAALRAAPPGRYAPRALRAQPFCKHEKNAYFPLCEDAPWDLRHVRDGRRRIYPTVGRGCPRPSHSKERAEAEAARANVGMARAGPSRSTPTAAAAAARGSAGFALGASLLIPRVWCARHCLCILIAA